MKRFLTIFVSFLIAGQFLFAADLFFSEYIEGSSNNKALEIYNPTDQTISLSNYILFGNANEATGWEYNYPFPDGATIASGDVYVVVDDAASTELLTVADWVDIGYTLGFNGNDGRGLMKINGSDTTLIDIIGFISNPSGDFPTVAGIANALLDHTLIRKSTVITGNTDWESSSGTNSTDSEWLVMNIDDFSNLGFHLSGSGTNIHPNADAGSDQIVVFGASVTLDGSASSDPDGSITAYHWNQVTGSTVILTNQDQMTAMFTAPSTESILEFELTVTDDSSAVSKDTVSISIVDNAPAAIIISEYVEGSSYNKYIELYNASDIAVDLISEGYEIRKAANGSGSFTDNFSDWGSKAVLQPGAVIVLSDMQATIYASTDIVMSTQFSVMSFNGNDAFGLFRNGLLVDVVGEPSNSTDIIKDMTLRRKNTVLYGNTTYTVDEWEEFAQDNIDNLGTHSTNPNAPAISNVILAQDFITSAMEIELSAEIVPAEGKEISVALIKYGTGGSFPNQAEMWLDNGNTWMGVIPAQAAYTELDYKIVATDNESNSGESTAASVLIADATSTNIAVIRADKNNYIGNMVTVQGIVTIGSDLIDHLRTKVYLQDASGKGINLFDYNLISGLVRGDELHMVGTVAEYNSVLELTDFNFEKVSTGNDLPEVQTISIADANSLEYEGTLVKFNGIISDTSVAGGGVSVYVKQGDDSTTVRIWESTGIDFASINIGSSYWFQGVVNPYYSDFQLLVAYQADIWAATAIDEHIAVAVKFDLHPAYPNPFNPTTTISWNLDHAGEYELAAYNMVGQKVDVISKSFGPAGAYTVNWNAGSLPSGVYFIQLDAQNRHLTQKVLLIK